ncbi:MAG: hypothetical protein MI745_14025 [Pseudomonadales bacterium]|nr:hypothetical protein [Pseudomonadales bacterium]
MNEEFSAIDARFQEMNKTILGIVRENTQLQTKVEILDKEMDAVRDAKHYLANQMNLHRKDIDHLDESLSDIRSAVQDLAKSINTFTKFSWILSGMGLLAGSSAFYLWLDAGVK